MTPDVDVAIVGAGPAGLSAAIELRRRGVGRVVVLEREQVAGGIPRHTAHLGYGARDLHRMTTGPRYAALLTRRAEKAGVEIQLGRSVQSFVGGQLFTTGASGQSQIQAHAVVLATGVRERPRAARLVPGDRPAGVLTTGSLQQFTTLHHQRVGTRAVVVGAEHVSFSAVLTLAHAGCKVAAMVTALPRHQTYAPLRIATAGRHRVPIHTGVTVAEIVGRSRVEAVVLTDGRRIECDTIVFTGDWIPDHELARSAGLPMLSIAKSPIIDDGWHTEQSGVFAIGNLVHPAETADVCALDGRAVAEHVMDWLTLGRWPAAVAPINVSSPIAWAAASSVGVTFRVEQFVTGSIEVSSGSEVRHRTKRKQWIPNRAYHVKGFTDCSELRFRR
ncbi:MAG: NAD(P)/FAD-dependent oxidoreductase [Actinomycetia bacterium]|nr:NAD(P)/FAD-dependent oxidoreductase [Actinomycetes bacterium]